MTSKDWPPPAEYDPAAFEEINQGRWTGKEIARFSAGFGSGAMIFTLLYNLPA